MASATKQKIRVLLADDHAIVRRGVKLILTGEPDIDVVAEAEDGVRAVEVARQLKPDVAVLDISMPGINGIEATRQTPRVAKYILRPIVGPDATR